MKYCISKCGMQVCLHCGLPEKLEQTYSVLKCNCIEDVKSLTVGILLVVPNKTSHYTCQKTNRKKKKGVSKLQHLLQYCSKLSHKSPPEMLEHKKFPPIPNGGSPQCEGPGKCFISLPRTTEGNIPSRKLTFSCSLLLSTLEKNPKQAGVHILNNYCLLHICF